MAGLIPSPAYAWVALAIGAAGFGAGWLTNDWRRDSQALKVERADNVAAIRQIDNEADKGRAFENKAGKIQVRYRTVVQEVDRVVEKPVYRNICIDDDGMRLLRAANADEPVPAGEPLPAVPGSP